MDKPTINKVIYYLLKHDHHLPYAWVLNYGVDDGQVPGFQGVVSELKRLNIVDITYDKDGHENFLLTMPARETVNNLPFKYKGDPYGYFRYKDEKRNAVTEETLELELENLRNEYKDYPETRKFAKEAHKWSKDGLCVAKWALGISALTLVTTVIIILLTRYKVWPFDK